MKTAMKTLFEIKKMFSREEALEFCRNKKELRHKDITEGKNDNYPNVFTFEDGSILYVGSDNHIYIDSCTGTINITNMWHWG